MKRFIPILVFAVLASVSCTKLVQKTIYETVVIRDTVSSTTYIVDTINNTVYIKDTVVLEHAYSIQAFGVLPENSPRTNMINLQEAIDWASSRGAALFVEPVEGGYPMRGGLLLRKNVSLIGVHGPTGRGTSYNGGPTGSLFVITDTSSPFITVESATQISGIQFYYPNQPSSNVSDIIEYPPTIQLSKTSGVEGVTLRDLTFYGETFAMDFRATKSLPCEQIYIENCYGYPLSGQFIAIDHCYDIPRILHCHVNPANQREFGKGFPKGTIDYVVSKRTYTYWIDHTDNAQCMDIFTFGAYGGIYLGASTYGQLTNFNFDCVCNGIYKGGDTPFNRVWEVAQGSIIANASPSSDVTEIHPFYVTGMGHLSITNVDAFSGNNSALTNLGKSYDFLKIESDYYVDVTGVNCRMRNYYSDNPITVNAPKAQLSFINCANKDGNIFSWSYGLLENP